MPDEPQPPRDETFATSETLVVRGPIKIVDPSSMFRDARSKHRYKRKGLLRRGGMGEVHLAEDTATGRHVAMKTMSSAEGYSSAVESPRRFAREARVQAQLEHPAIVPVYDVGVDVEDDNLYFTMQLLRGQGLDEILQLLGEGDEEAEARFTRRKLLSIFSSVCMAVEYAHSRGVVHRDLKPANIMLGDFGEVYVLDWGLADVRSDTAEGEHTPSDSEDADWRAEAKSGPVSDADIRPETLEGEVMGTPGYMSPEQVRGRDDLIGPCSDVYALGVILFELLTLQRLHKKRKGEKLAEVMMSTLGTDGARPGQAAPDRNIPPELDALCATATRSRPEHRLASPRIMAEAIEAYLDGDRDMERRRVQAEKKAALAARSLQRSLRGDVDEAVERAQAMREVTAALGLDPENASARNTLVRLLGEPPRTIPAAARKAMDESAVNQFRVVSRGAMAVYLSYLLYVPFLFWMGLRTPWMLAVMASSIVGLLAITFYFYKRPPANLQLPMVHLLATMAAMAFGTVIFGPLLFLPVVVIGSSVAVVTNIEGRMVHVTIAGCLAVLGPLALQLLGVLEMPYVFHDGAMTIVPNMLWFPKTATLGFLVITNTVLIASTCLVVAWLRRSYVAAERQLQLQAWQLRQLMP